MRPLLPQVLLPAVLFGFVCSVFPLGAQTAVDQFSLAFWGSILIFPEDNGLESDPTPINPSAGAAGIYSLSEFLGIELSMDFYGSYYGYSDTLQRAIPANPENRSGFVIGSVLALQAVGNIGITDSTRFRIYGGPAADLRLCLPAGGLEGDDAEDASRETGDISAYFWDKGRWFLPVVGMGLDFDALKNMRLGFDARVWFPLYRLWTGEDLPAIEGWRFSFGFRVTIGG
jgi:hypothetical protein